MSRFVLDCAVSRPASDQVARWYASALQRGWADPTAGYHEGKQASMLLDQSSATIAGLVDARNVWFCADLAAAVDSALRDLTAHSRSIATTAVDSVRVQAATRRAAASTGVPFRQLAVDAAGRVDPAELQDLATPAVLVTNLGNQEIGTVQRDLADWAESTGSAVVLDASAAFGWIDVPVGWSRLLLDARAWGGVPGAVAVCSSGPAPRRPGENVPACVVAALAAQDWLARAPEARRIARAQMATLREHIGNGIRGVEVRGGTAGDLPHILSVSVLYVDAEALQGRLDARGYAVGSGSACASRQGQPSHVLAAVGGMTGGNLRVGLPPGLPEDAVSGFAQALVQVVAEERSRLGTQDL